MTRLALGAILLVGLYLRLWDITTNPPELFEDEISGAMSAWSVVTTGHDVIEDHLPLFTTRLGPQLPIYGLLTVPFQAVLGHTVLAARLPAVLLGLAVIVLLYLFTRAIAGRGSALVAAAVVAVLPWAVHFSRVGWDNAAYPPLLLGGLLVLLGALDRGPAARLRLFAAAALLGLTAYSYQIAIAMTPLFLAAVLWAKRDAVLRFRPRDLIAAAAIGAVVAAPYVWTFWSVPLFRVRSAGISTFAEGVRASTLERFMTNYLANLSPTFLFVSGDDNLRHGTGRGELLLWMLPFAILGTAWALMRARRSALAFIAIAWLALAPLPAALTADGVPHAARSMLELIVWPILIAIGLRLAWPGRLRRRAYVPALTGAVLAVCLGAATAETVSYYRYVFASYPARSTDAWHSGTASVMSEIRTRTPRDGRACVATESPFTFRHIVRWYLGDAPGFSVVEGGAAQCPAPGDIIALAATDPAPERSVLIASVTDRTGGLVARIWRRAPR